MGGRLALHAALAMPERVERLVLVSASAGIEDAGERERRREADEALAREIEGHDIEWFVERWRAVPLFAGDPPWVVEEVARDERRCTPATLAACLRAFGPGTMTPVWDRLGELAMPVTVLAGERDEQYVAAGRRLVAAIPDAELAVVRRRRPPARARGAGGDRQRRWARCRGRARAGRRCDRRAREAARAPRRARAWRGRTRAAGRARRRRAARPRRRSGPRRSR